MDMAWIVMLMKVGPYESNQKASSCLLGNRERKMWEQVSLNGLKLMHKKRQVTFSGIFPWRYWGLLMAWRISDSVQCLASDTFRPLLSWLGTSLLRILLSFHKKTKMTVNIIAGKTHKRVISSETLPWPTPLHISIHNRIKLYPTQVILKEFCTTWPRHLLKYTEKSKPGLSSFSVTGAM